MGEYMDNMENAETEMAETEMADDEMENMKEEEMMGYAGSKDEGKSLRSYS